eukprot:5610131-Prymnesium_polylepis.1
MCGDPDRRNATHTTPRHVPKTEPKQQTTQTFTPHPTCEYVTGNARYVGPMNAPSTHRSQDRSQGHVRRTGYRVRMPLQCAKNLTTQGARAAACGERIAVPILVGRG